jgi:hypothetical protein
MIEEPYVNKKFLMNGRKVKVKKDKKNKKMYIGNKNKMNIFLEINNKK